VFTSKRFIFIDIQGWSGKKVKYMSIPWTTITVFSVQSAGSFLDKDSAVMLWTDFDDLIYPPKSDEDDTPSPPIPRYSFIEVDFRKDCVDLYSIHRYLSERCLRVEGCHKDAEGYYVPNLRPYNMPVFQESLTTQPDALDSFLSWLGNDSHEINPAEVTARLHDGQLLQANKKAVLAYKCGRDELILTNKRVFIIYVQGYPERKLPTRAYPSHPFRILVLKVQDLEIETQSLLFGLR
jgi:hypothetical protein